MTGIAFKIPAYDRLKVEKLPTFSGIKTLSSIHKDRKNIVILYQFEFMPQSWKEWQRVASIKHQIRLIIPSVEFVEFNCSSEVIERIWTISDLGKFFKEFVKFPKPFYPQAKDEMFSRLIRYAQRLYWYNMLYFEAVMAMAIHFNSIGQFGFNRKEVAGKVKAVMNLDTTDWRKPLSSDALAKAHKRGANITNGNARGRAIINGFITKAIVDNGQSINDSCTILCISKSTAKRILADARKRNEI